MSPIDLIIQHLLKTEKGPFRVYESGFLKDIFYVWIPRNNFLAPDPIRKWVLDNQYNFQADALQRYFILVYESNKTDDFLFLGAL